jgi:hypothetical protein
MAHQETVSERNYRHQKQDWCVDSWLKRKYQISLQDLEHHPQTEHITLLLRIKQEFHKELSEDLSAAATWGAYWGLVYRNHNAIQARGYIKLERMFHRLEMIRQQQQARIGKIHQIKAHRQTSKADHDITAKGSGQPCSKSVKREQLVCREDLSSSPPWL